MVTQGEERDIANQEYVCLLDKQDKLTYLKFLWKSARL